MASCLFCYKETQLVSDNDGQLVKKFVRLVERFVGRNNGVDLLQRISENVGETRIIGCCGDCEVVISGFCKAYHEMKSWELRVEWKLEVLLKIVKMSSKVPGRLKEMERRLRGIPEMDKDEVENKLKNVRNLRQYLKRKGSEKLHSSFPRVVISQNKAGIFPDLEDVSKRGKPEENPQSVLVYPPQIPSAHDQFVKWILYFAVLTWITPILPVALGDLLSLRDSKTREIRDLTLSPLPSEQKGISDLLKEHEMEDNCVDGGSPAEKYSLRRKRPISYLSTTENDESEPDKIDRNPSEDDDFDGTSSDSSWHTNESENEPEKDKNLPPFPQHHWRTAYDNRNGSFRCKLKGCNEVDHEYPIPSQYSQHLNLHTPGHFKCQLCETEEDNVVLLCLHEMSVHLSKQDNTEAEKLTCSRCNFSSAKYSDLFWHFGKKHFENLKLPRIQPTKVHFINCPICQRRIKSFRFASHWVPQHNTEGVNPESIVRCKETNCSAFFLRRGQLAAHLIWVHNMWNRNDDNASSEHLETLSRFKRRKVLHSKRDLKCELCNKKFFDVVASGLPPQKISWEGAKSGGKF